MRRRRLFLVRHAEQSGNNDVFTALLSPNHAEGNPNKTISDESGESGIREFSLCEHRPEPPFLAPRVDTSNLLPSSYT